MPWVKTYHPPGTAPGTLSARAAPDTAAMALHLIDFSDQDFIEVALASAAACAPYVTRESKTWVHVSGRPDADTLRALGAQFGLHDLALEDVLNTGQRPKIDLYPEQLFLVLNLPWRREDGSLEITQVSLFAGDNFLISFCPLPTDPFEPIRSRLRPPNNARMRMHKIDYLLYSLLDLVIDAGFPILEELGDRIEQIEEELLDRPDRSTLSRIHRLRRDLLHLRRMLWPQREVVSTLLHGDLQLIDPRTHPYLRDCYDHSIQIMDLQESFREMSTSLLDVYLSSISHRTNEIMRVLTIISTIFIPLTFIVGIYGMNFDPEAGPWSMPELRWYFGYPLIWGVMLMIVLGLLWYFKRRDWF